MAGIRQVLALQEENRGLQAEVTRLKRRDGRPGPA
jgi:hypothetical protein